MVSLISSSISLIGTVLLALFITVDKCLPQKPNKCHSGCCGEKNYLDIQWELWVGWLYWQLLFSFPFIISQTQQNFVEQRHSIKLHPPFFSII